MSSNYMAVHLDEKLPDLTKSASAKALPTMNFPQRRNMNGAGPKKPQIGSLRGKVPLIFGPSRLGCGQRIIESCGQLLSKIRAASMAVASAGLKNSWNPNDETVPLAAVAEADESPTVDVPVQKPLLLSVSTTSVPCRLNPVRNHVTFFLLTSTTSVMTHFVT